MNSGVRDQPGQHSETAISSKKQKIILASWCLPVVLAIQEAEVGGLPEPGEFWTAVSHDHTTALQHG